MAEDRVEQVARVLHRNIGPYWPPKDGPDADPYGDMARAVIAHLDAEYARRVAGALKEIGQAQAAWYGAMRPAGIVREEMEVLCTEALALLATDAPTPCPRCAEWKTVASGNNGTNNHDAKHIRLQHGDHYEAIPLAVVYPGDCYQVQVMRGEAVAAKPQPMCSRCGKKVVHEEGWLCSACEHYSGEEAAG